MAEVYDIRQTEIKLLVKTTRKWNEKKKESKKKNEKKKLCVKVLKMYFNIRYTSL